MRLIPLLALLAAAPLAAQTPDPTPPDAYYPLGIGDVREYIQCRWRGFFHSCQWVGTVRYTIVRDTTIHDTTYVVEHSTVGSGNPDLDSPRLLRFDSTTATVRLRTASGREGSITCRLDADFDAGVYCVDRIDNILVNSDTAYVNAPEPNQKAYQTDPYPGCSACSFDIFQAGVGRVWRSGFYVTEAFDVLTYAFINGEVVHGQPVDGPEPPPRAQALALAASPNPTAGPLALSLTLASPRAVVVEAFDVLGRRVHHVSATLGAGAQTLSVDASRWTPGFYVVRATTEDGATATARVVRR